MLKIYLKLILTFWKVLFNIHHYKDLLNLESKPTKRFEQLKRPLQRRYIEHKKSKTPMFKEDLFLYLTIDAFQETENEKEEILAPLCMLLLIYQSKDN